MNDTPSWYDSHPHPGLCSRCDRLVSITYGEGDFRYCPVCIAAALEDAEVSLRISKAAGWEALRRIHEDHHRIEPSLGCMFCMTGAPA